MADAWRNWRGEQIINSVRQAFYRACDKSAHVVLTETKQEVPLDEGPLMRSGVIIMRWQNNNPVAIISYGGGAGTGFPKLPYAIRWHETDANFQHGRKKNYVRDPFNRLAASSFQRALVEELSGIL